ncbi:tyrosine-type recombinase/integrase [Nocardia mangyaensis]|uniref:tyrosine-type recombinase/integrase n=1 Tax=Nocardia mangyaensis TaxID=2213200 RepID=UPI0026775640|nr:site-specific integrase [Nocardia mangyaensis]MDO3649835.1 site-specific integrase [Nocardia mangyaensis]
MTGTVGSPINAEALAAARLLLAQMGIAATDLIDTAPTAPTFAEAIPRVRARLTAGTARTYGTHFDLLESRWANRSLGGPTHHELEELAQMVQANARTNRASRGGTSAVEHYVSAVRCIYRYAEEAGWIRPQDNPARKLPIPTRRASHRYAIPSGQVAEICQIAATSGDDPELDSLILRFHLETACRRGGALAMRPQDLDRDQCLVFLREKGGSDRWQPVSPTLMRHLHDHASTRHAPFNGQLLRYHHGRPITGRRYDYIWSRVSESLPWVATQGVTHTLAAPHHADVGRTHIQLRRGTSFRRAPRKDHWHNRYLRQSPSARSRGRTSRLTGEPHPLARGAGIPTPPKALTAD